MNIGPIERYTIVKITTYQNGESIAEPLVDDRVFSSLDDANEFLCDLLYEEFTHYWRSWHPSQWQCAYDSLPDGRAVGVVYSRDNQARVDIYVDITKFVLDARKEEKADEQQQ